MGIQLLADSAELPQVSTTISRWFASSANQLPEIHAGSLKTDKQISQLVQAMATQRSWPWLGFVAFKVKRTSVPSRRDLSKMS